MGMPPSLRFVLTVLPLVTARLEDVNIGVVEIAPRGLAPRYFQSLERSASAPFLVRRDGNCDEGSHNCLDIQHPERCCANDSYCYINASNEPKCCPIGSNCVNDSPCSSQAYYCLGPAPSSPSSTSAAPTQTTASRVPGCCARACPQTSYYLCPQSLGGNCCPFGSDCRFGGHCVSTLTATPTPRLTPVVEGCTTAQHACADGVSGCCDDGMSCTLHQGTGYCASPTPTSTSTPTAAPDHHGKGGTVGVAVGVSLGVVLAIACVAWLLLLKRRHDRQMREEKHEDLDGNPGVVWSPDVGSDTPLPPTPHIVLHEPNGPGAAPVEIDSAEKAEGTTSEGDPLTPRSQVSELEEGRQRLHAPVETSWLALSPVSPSSASEHQ